MDDDARRGTAMRREQERINLAALETQAASEAALHAEIAATVSGMAAGEIDLTEGQERVQELMAKIGEVPHRAWRQNI